MTKETLDKANSIWDEIKDLRALIEQYCGRQITIMTTNAIGHNYYYTPDSEAFKEDLDKLLQDRLELLKMEFELLK